MDRLIASNSVPMAQADTAPLTGTPQGSTDGNPATNIPATRWPAYQYNAIQEELIAILTAAGITPDRTNNAQIAAAINAIKGKTTVLADTGTVNAYAAANATPLVVGTWSDGVVQAVKIANSNTAASTYAPDGLAAIPIYGLGLTALQGGELIAGGTAILMHATIPGVNSGNPICVLMECAGGAQQIPPATKSQHAVQLQQVPARAMSYNTTSGSFTVPANITRLKATAIGGGAGGCGCFCSSGLVNASGGGGGAGAMAVGWFAVTPGQVISYTIGAGGTGAGASGSTSGGSTSVLGMTAGGGFATALASSVSSGGSGGTATGGQINTSGAYGADGQAISTAIFTGNGGSGPFGGAGRAGNGGGNAATAPGAGGGGAYDVTASGTSKTGGNGAPGAVIFEW